MPKSKRNTELLQHLIQRRRSATYRAERYNKDTANPIHRQVYQLGMYPDAERIKRDIATDIIIWDPSAWQETLTPDAKGNIANLFLMDYDAGQSAETYSSAYYYPFKSNETPLFLDAYDRKLVSINHSDGLATFCMDPLYQFIEIFRTHDEAFEDTNDFWNLCNLVVASSHILAHLAFDHLHQRGEFNGRGLSKRTFIATKEHGESYANMVYIID